MGNSADRVRVRAVGIDGMPLGRIRVELLAGRSAAKGAKTPGDGAVVLRGLSTSPEGFAIFSMASVPWALRSEGALAVRFAQNADLTFPLTGALASTGSHYVTYTLQEGPWMELDPVPGRWHDDGLDADDVWAIPGVFPDLGPLQFGDDRCGRLIPNDQTVRTSNHHQVVRTRKNVVTCLRAPVVAGEGKGATHASIDVAPSGPRGREVRLSEGELISYEIKSTRLGYTFGDLLYSLPLAPCESVTLAISHWEQRQAARAEQDSVAAETRDATYYRQNALSEAMSAVSASSHHGWAVMAGKSNSGTASASGIVSGIALKVAGAFQTTVGASASGSYDRKSFATNATRSFSDRIQSSAEAMRRDHQVVIMEQSESERQEISYRTVCNNNHCHVLNIFYHEVLNNFRITTKVLGHREVYFVPYEVQAFDLELALCARPILLPFLIDESLRECYGTLGMRTASPAGPATVDQFKIDLVVSNAFGVNASGLTLMVQPKIGPAQQFAVPGVGSWSSGQTCSYVVDTTNFDPTQLHEVGFLKVLGGGLATHLSISAFTISVKGPNGQWTPIATGGPISEAGHVLMTSSPASYSPAAGSPVSDDGDCTARVLAHLNCNAHYYNSLLWLLEDPNARLCRFDKILCDETGNSLADLILAEPLAVMGCSVAFAKADGEFQPHDGPPIVDERLLTLPTPGIFADAALGQCSACETKDDTVYWDWKDTPCSCAGKDVTLRTPVETPLMQGGVAVFPTMPTAAWATSVGPPSGETGTSNSLVEAFGGELAKAILAGGGSSEEMTQLSALLTKMTEAVKDLTPAPGDAPPVDPPTGGSGGTGTTGGSGGTGGTDTP